MPRCGSWIGQAMPHNRARARAAPRKIAAVSTRQSRKDERIVRSRADSLPDIFTLSECARAAPDCGIPRLYSSWTRGSLLRLDCRMSLSQRISRNAQPHRLLPDAAHVVDAHRRLSAFFMLEAHRPSYPPLAPAAAPPTNANPPTACMLAYHSREPSLLSLENDRRSPAFLSATPLAARPHKKLRFTD